MKKFLIFLILFAFLFAGCSTKETAPIVATTLPVWEFTNALCRNTGLTVDRLITEEISCLHDYSLNVSQIRSIEAAYAIVSNGAGLEPFLADILTDRSNVIDASTNIALICSEDEDHGAHHHAHDQHIWLSPENAKEMSRTICAKLIELYPEHTDLFTDNLAQLLAELDTLQSYGDTALAELRCRELITFHDGFAYFAEAFHLHILKAVEEESGSEASARKLIELIDLVSSHSLPAVFTETNGSTSAAGIIALETGAAVYTLDMAMAGESYFDAMYRNIDTIKEALG